MIAASDRPRCSARLRDRSRRRTAGSVTVLALSLAALWPAAPAAAAQADGPVDVFAIAGQSNAQGRGDFRRSVRVARGEGLEWNGERMVHAADPVGDAKSGSAWPAFARTYFARTGRVAAFVEVAKPGTTMTQFKRRGRGCWCEEGELLEPALDEYDRAIEWARGDGLDPSRAGVLWSQGEADALARNAGRKSHYRREFADLLARIETRSAGLPVYVFRTGRARSGRTAGFRRIRAAQEQVARATGSATVVFRRSLSFARRGLMRDEVHYNQRALNEMGSRGAAAVAGASRDGSEG